MILHPGYGVSADIARFFGLQPVDWFAAYPLFSIIVIVAWQWLPFATLILLTSLQSLDSEQKEAAEMDGAGFVSRFWHLTLPHMARAITIVVLIQTIFLLGVYAEILVTTNGGPGYASTNLPFLIYRAARLSQRRRRRGRGRHRRGRPRQHRRHLPDARRRQEPGLRSTAMARAVPTRTKVSYTDRRLGRRAADLLPDPLHDHHLAAGPSRRRSAASPSGPPSPSRATRRCRASRTTSGRS